MPQIILSGINCSLPFLFLFLPLVLHLLSLFLIIIFLFLFDPCAFLFLQHADSWLQGSQLFKCHSLLQKRKGDSHENFILQQLVHKLVDVDDAELSDGIAETQFTIIVVEGL